MRHKPVCSKCGLEMVVALQGVMVVDMAYKPPQPYTVTMADEYRCPSCYVKVIAGWANEPILHSHNPEMKSKLWEAVQDYPEKLRINWEKRVSGVLQEWPVSYLLDWLRKEGVDASE